MWIIFIIVFYFLSYWGSYKYIQKSHYHEYGQWAFLEPDIGDFIMVIMPFINTGWAILYLIGDWKKTESKNNFYHSFFKPKNKK